MEETICAFDNPYRNMKPRKYRALGLPATPGTALLAIVFVLSVSPRLVGATSPASDQSVDPALDTGSVTGQVPMRTLAVNPGSKTPVNVVLLVPYRDTFKWSYPKIMPAVEIALQKIDADENLLPDHYLRLRYFDSNCDDAVSNLSSVVIVLHVSSLTVSFCLT